MGQLVQAKLSVNAPGDVYEQEADRVADAVIEMPESAPGFAADDSPSPVQRKCAACASGESLCPDCAAEEQFAQRKSLAGEISSFVQRQQAEEDEEERVQARPISGLAIQRDASEKEDEQIQTKASSGMAASRQGWTALVNRIDNIRHGGGQPLPAPARTFFESRFGRGFDEVRVHTDAAAAATAQAINARAYTLGNHVVFGAGQYAPGTIEGKRLLAHELTHTLQQGAARKMQASRISRDRDQASLPEASHHGGTIAAKNRTVHKPIFHPARPGVTHSSSAPMIQRQPAQAACSAARPACNSCFPEDCVTFEEWLSGFAGLPSFAGEFIDPQGVDRDPQQVLGERAPAIPTYSGPPTPLRGNTQGIERPWAGWLRANLSPHLIEVAYELPTDCADIVLILRHVWLAAHGRRETVGRWVLGRGVGRQGIRSLLGPIYTGTLKQGMIAFYRDVNGDPITSFHTLLPLLHPGDVLVWEHRDARGRRTGGHSETIDSISFNPTVITTLQGNQPLSSRSGDTLGQLPGWRIERGGLAPGDLRDINGVWTWDDGTTVLIGAGPWGATPQATARPPRPPRGTAAPVLRDWSRSLRGAALADLPGILESALGEARAALEGQRTVPEAEARRVGEQIGRRLWMLAHRAGDLGVASHFEPLTQLLEILEAYHRLTRPTASSTQVVIDTVYGWIHESLELAARGASTIDFSRSPGRRKRGVNILATGFDPFTGSGARPSPEAWNTSGAAALALDGENIPAGGDVVARVESIVLPVDYRSFATGMVESIIGPRLSALDAVVTISMDSRLSGQAALERYAVNYHRVSHPLPGSGATPAVQTGPIPLHPGLSGSSGSPPGPGPAVLPTWNQLEVLAQGLPTSPGVMGAFVRSDLTLRFGSEPEARSAIQDLGLGAAQFRRQGADVTYLDPVVIGRLLAVAQTPAGQPANHLRWPAFQGGRATFAAEVVEGPGGDFLSNEVSYRVLRLLRQQTAPNKSESFHVHTPNAPPVPVAERTERRSAARRAAMTVRASVIAGLRFILARLARLLRP